MELPEGVLKRVGLHLLIVGGDFNAGSLCVSFLHAVFTSVAGSYPILVTMKVTGDHMILTVEGANLAINTPEWEQLAHFLRLENRQQLPTRDIPRDLAILRPIVWFSEYCVVDVSNMNGLHRQAFVGGSPIGEPVVVPDVQKGKAKVTLCLTLRAGIFGDALDLRSFRHIISLWRKLVFPEELPDGTRQPNLRFKWTEHAAYNYDVDISAE